MFAIKRELFLFTLPHIPFNFKYKYHSEKQELDSYTFDFRHKCLNFHKLKKTLIYKFIVKHNIQKHFIILCKHHYFHRFGPRLTGILTRQTKKFKKYYQHKGKQKRCCDCLVLLAKAQWNAPIYKHSKFKR